MMASKNPAHDGSEIDAAAKRGDLLLQQGRLGEAITCFQSILGQDPEHPDANDAMGRIAVGMGKKKAAIGFFRKAVVAQPQNPLFNYNLGEALVIAKAVEEGITYLETAVRLNPGMYNALCSLGRAYRARGKVAEGIPYLRRAVQLHPGDPAGLLELAYSLVALGEPEQAHQFFAAAAETSSVAPHAIVGLVTSRKQSKEDNDLAKVQRQLATPTTHPERKVLNFAAAKIHLELGQYTKAFEYFAASKERSAGSSVDVFKETVSRTIELFDRDLLQRFAGLGDESELPVFILGMPRSGTTLIEQIVASHPLAYGAGELPHLGNVISKQFGKIADDPQLFFEKVRALTREEAVRAGRSYLENLRWHSDSALRISDKMPHNFKHLGLLSILLPKAHVIHCRRDPIDNCVSIYTQLFNEKHDYGARLRGLGQYYRAYDRLMVHWRNVLPITIHEVRYEDMIADQEGQSRKLIDFIGLPWDPACLQFYESARGVTTPSQLQVRQPIYSSSVKRWKAFEPHIRDLIEELGDLAVTD